MNMIEIKDLVKTYDSKAVPVKAIDGITLSFKEGEFTAVVGPSGSGKTTLLNIVGGLDEPTAGSVFINGQNIGELTSSQLINYRLHHIGFVFQAYNLIPVLTAQENVEFIMELQGKTKSEREQRAQELLEAVGLGDRLNTRPGELSGGQQQRVAVARSLASKPTFILADEPTANLDSATAENLLDIMGNLNKEAGITFIFSTHDPRVMNKARRIVTIQDGKVVKDEKKS
jgi:putative ABC transport system ATP-binding protein